MAQKTFLQIEGLSSETLFKEFSKILDARFLRDEPKTDEDKFITRQAVADMFEISLPTVHSWANCGILKPYKIGNKTRFLLSEVKAAAIKNGSKKGVEND
jgi:predicted DNA-binding transcriptional regulator AlpA